MLSRTRRQQEPPAGQGNRQRRYQPRPGIQGRQRRQAKEEDEAIKGLGKGRVLSRRDILSVAAQLSGELLEGSGRAEEGTPGSTRKEGEVPVVGLPIPPL